MTLSVTPLQEAWLTELGVDAQWLARLRQAPDPGAAPAAAPVVSVAASPATQEAPPAAAGPVSVAALLGSDALAQFTRTKTGRRPAAVVPVQASLDVSGVSDLAALHARILVCEACPLYTGRSHAVPGAGETLAPDYLIVGEMPGVDDDMSGLPFQGAAGDLLQAMLASAGLTQKTVFMSTVIKCRPSGGRAAQATEVAACMPYLRQQIELLRPRHILALGRLAARAVLDTRESFAALRGQAHRYQTADGHAIPVWVTHHPASLLLRPAHKAEAWRDLMQLTASADSGEGAA